MPDGGKDDIGVPLGAVAKRLEVEGKTKITCHGNMPYTLLRGSLVWQVRSNPRTCQPYPPQKATEGRCVWQVIFGFVLQGELWGFAG